MKHPLLLKLLSKTLSEELIDRRNLGERDLLTESYYFGGFIADIERPTLSHHTLSIRRAAMPDGDDGQGLRNRLSTFIQTHNHQVERITVIGRKTFARLIADLDKLFPTVCAVRDVNQRSDDKTLEQKMADFKQRWPFVASIVESYFNFYLKESPLPVPIKINDADYTVQLDEKLLSDQQLDDETDELFKERMAFRKGYFDEKSGLDEDSNIIDFAANQQFLNWLIEVLNVKIGGDPRILRHKFNGLFYKYKILIDPKSKEICAIIKGNELKQGIN